MSASAARPPFPPFTEQSAAQTARSAEDAWNSRDPAREAGLMRRRLASINDVPITEVARLFRWPLGRRPDEHAGLSDLGL